MSHTKCFPFFFQSSRKRSDTISMAPQRLAPSPTLGQQLVLNELLCSCDTFGVIIMGWKAQSNIAKDYYTFKSPVRTRVSA